MDRSPAGADQLRILIASIYPYPHSSPPANYMQRVSRGLRRMGHDVLILAPQQPGQNSPPAGSDKYGTKYVSFIFPRKPRWLPYYPHMLRQVRPSLQRTVADALDHGGRWDAALLLGDSWWILDPIRRHCQATGVRVIPMITEWPPATLSGLVGLSWPDQWMFRRQTVPACDGVVGISRLWAEFASRRGVPATVLPAFSKYPDHELPHIESRQNPRFRIVYVGRWVRRELPCTLMRGMELALKAGIDLELVVLGPAGRGLSFSQRVEERPAMRFLEGAPHVRQRIKLLGWLDDEAFERETAAADAFVLLRQDSHETRALFPTRLPEFLATGKPLIVSDAGDLTLYLKHMQSAFVIPPGDQPEALAQAIAFLASNPDKSHLIGLGGRAAIEGAFSQTLLAGRLADFVRTLARARAPF